MPIRFFLIVLLLVAGSARADIVLLLSDSKASVTGVAKAIAAAYGQKLDIYNLEGSRGKEAEITQAILSSDKQRVIAIGLLAAQLARQRLSSKQVVFCQVLNFEEFDLISPSMKGISGIPSLSMQFAAWKMLDPTLRRVGVITGRHTRYMVREAEAAAKHNGLQIIHVAVPSDRAVLFGAQELYEKKIQGLWLAPDSSIFNQQAIHQLMSYSVKHNLQVLAFSPVLLKEGALLSATSDFNEIARLALERLNGSGAAGTHSADITPLSMARIVISSSVAARFGLPVPVRLRELADVQ